MTPKIRYIIDDKSLLSLHILRDMYALVIHNIKLFGESQSNQFLGNLLAEIQGGDEVLV